MPVERLGRGGSRAAGLVVHSLRAEAADPAAEVLRDLPALRRSRRRRRRVEPAPEQARHGGHELLRSLAPWRTHPKFRGFIIGLAQANHRLATNMQRRIHGRALDIHIRPLNEDKAIQAAADLLGELFVFSVASGAIIFEVQRSARSEARKEEIRKQEVEAIRKRMDELDMEKQIMRQRLAEMEQRTWSGGWVFPRILNFGPAHVSVII